MKKHFFFLLFALVASLGSLFASDTQVNGIWYDFDSSTKTATVTYRGSFYFAYSNEYTGKVVIPASVTYNNEEYNVTSIGEYAFCECSSLTSVTIPNSVTSIGDDAFRYCSGLTSPVYNTHVFAYMPTSYSGAYTIPDGIESIAGNAFYGCSGLTSIEIPNSVTSIGGSAFSRCSGLTSVTIPNSVTSIEGGAFAYCSGLTSINVASDNSNYCSVDGVLFNKDKTTLIQYPGGKQGAYTIPNSVTSIGSNAFKGCSSLTSITIPNSVTSIGSGAFWDCTGLTSITIEAETPPALGDLAFGFGFESEFDIYVSCGALDAYKSAWAGYANRIRPDVEYTITGKVDDANAGSVDYPTSSCGDVVITAVPNNGYHFTQWSDGLKDNPRTIELTQDTTFTAEFAFDRSGKCGNDSLLTWTYNPEQKLLTISGNGAFDENMAYGAEAPKEMSRLIIENGVTSIGFAAFRNCSALESVSIPSSVSNIGAFAFSGTKLTQISLANTIQQVGSEAFANCPLEKIHWDIPTQSEVVSEGITVRLDASNLGWSKVNLYAWLDDYTQLLGSWPGIRLQAEANGFYSYTFPAEYNQINIIWNNGSSQTADIEDVTESTIYKLTGSTGTKIGWNSEELKASSPFYQCGETVTEFTLGNSVTSIPIGLCADFVKVERIDIPSSVTSIGAEAFKNCTSLKTLSLGENISSYGNEVFSGCSALDEIYNYRERPARLGTDAFAGVDYFESTLYVLANSVDMYKSAGSDWKIFYFIEPIGASTVTTDSVSVIPSNNSVLMTWPTNDNAASYTIEITKDGEVFCRLVFNANGQLTGIAFATSRNGTPRHAPKAKMTANGLQFTVTGLNSGTNYGYSVTTKDADDQPIASYSGEFSTTGEVPTSVDQVTSDQVQCTKVLRDGQIFILRGDKTYTITGQVVK